METETFKVSDLKKLIATAHATLCVVLHALNTKILVGEINRPLNSPPKIKRKRRTKKEIMQSGQRMELTPKVKMDLEKEYQIERLPTLIPTLQEKDLPEDKDPFFAKTKPKKKREKKIDGGE